MVKCVTKQGTKTKICAGDLNRPITILRLKQTASGNESTDYDIDFEKVADIWAMLDDSGNSVSKFEGTAIDPSITHFFYIRFIPNVDTRCTIRLKNLHNNEYKYFRVKAVKNIEELSGFLRIDCNERGKSTQESNFV